MKRPRERGIEDCERGRNRIRNIRKETGEEGQEQGYGEEIFRRKEGGK